MHIFFYKIIRLQVVYATKITIKNWNFNWIGTLFLVLDIVQIYITISVLFQFRSKNDILCYVPYCAFYKADVKKRTYFNCLTW